MCLFSLARALLGWSSFVLSTSEDGNFLERSWGGSLSEDPVSGWLFLQLSDKEVENLLITPKQIK